MTEEASSPPPSCPKCLTELNADFGITDCPGCGIVCFIDMDDSVKIQGEEEVAISREEIADEGEDVQDLADTEEAIENSYGDGIEEELDSSDEAFEVTAEDLSESEEVYQEGFNSDQELNENEAAPLSAATFLSDLEVFASGSDVKDFDSELYFDMKISGVELEENKNILIETVADSRLDLSEEKLLEDFVDEEGALYLSQIPFVRAVVIYKRILSLGLKVEWLQKEIHELEANVEDIPDETY